MTYLSDNNFEPFKKLSSLFSILGKNWKENEPFSDYEIPDSLDKLNILCLKLSPIFEKIRIIVTKRWAELDEKSKELIITIAYFLADEIRDDLEALVADQEKHNTRGIQVFLQVVDDFIDAVFDLIEEESPELQEIIDKSIKHIIPCNQQTLS